MAIYVELSKVQPKALLVQPVSSLLARYVSEGRTAHSDAFQRLPTVRSVGSAQQEDPAERWPAAHEAWTSDSDVRSKELSMFASASSATTLRNKPLRQRILSGLRIVAPHAALLAVLGLYTVANSLIMIALEGNRNVVDQQRRTSRIRTVYEELVNLTWSMDRNTAHNWSSQLEPLLRKLSSIHENDPDFDIRDPVESRWTMITSYLHTLTYLTTCSYVYVEPVTVHGRIFSVGFALMGIPLMFITGADIGKFLSEVLVMTYIRLLQLKVDVTSNIQARLRKKDRDFDAAHPYESESMLDCNVHSRKSSIVHSRMIPENDDDIRRMIANEEDDVNYGLFFPITAYVVLVSGYSALGALLYMGWEEGWEFSQAFSFSFNLITTVGLGSIIVENVIYLILVVAYVIVGLAVVTMCVDLASSQLKSYFQKIHYFGRSKPFWGMSEDLKHVLLALTEVKRRKGTVTWADLQLLMAQQELWLRPFAPRRLHTFRFIDESQSLYTAGSKASLQSVGTRRSKRSHKRIAESGGGFLNGDCTSMVDLFDSEESIDKLAPLYSTGNSRGGNKDNTQHSNHVFRFA